MELLKVSFLVQSLDDLVTSIADATLPNNTSVLDLIAGNPQYWIETDTNNVPHLCTVKTDQAPLSGNFKDSQNTPYTLQAKAFTVNQFFGGHPKERPHAN